MVDQTLLKLSLVEDQTQALLDWATAVNDSHKTYLQKAQVLARQLGAHYRADGLTQLGFWTPDLAGEIIQSDRQIYLEVLTPTTAIDFRQPEQTLSFQRDCIQLRQQGEYVWGVVAGMQPGTRDRAGSFYWLRFLDIKGNLRTIRDPLAYSMPYGVFGPAELYDMERMQRQRPDLWYFQRTGVPAPEQPDELDVESVAEQNGNALAIAKPEIPRVPSPTNILQIHVNTASQEGTLEALAEIYRQISDKLDRDQPLTPAEEQYIGYDAVQLLPIEPTIEYRLEDFNEGHEFFSIANVAALQDGMAEDPQTCTITLRKPDTQNWGYDVPILGSSATNPAVLGSLRPDETVDFIATLHNFSTGPIQVIYDLVYGHADNQSLGLISRQYLKGPNMYGQDLNHQLPAVRAILLEMQRRKLDTGIDGIRVDGGQDFRYFNPMSGRVEQDDAYLLAMSDVVQAIQGHQRLLFTIFEDGRPWPEEGWEETSTYRDLVDLRPESYQWGPLIFAHNTPTLKGFWDRKWQRIGEVIYQGDRWITGCANHDTVRRGNQVDPDSPINWNLGDTLPQVLRNAYQNPATLLWIYGFSPGLPMDFLNANFRAPWGFFRNTDDRYGVKVVSEEVGFLDWQVEPDLYQRPDAFPRLKALGFTELKDLKEFSQALRVAMIETDYDLEEVAQICQHCLSDDPTACEVPPLEDLKEPDMPAFLRNLDVHRLKEFAMAFMEDGHEFCKVSHYADNISAERSRYLLNLRQYRQANPWLGHNLTGLDRFNRISDDERTLFYGLRTEPLEDEASDRPRKQVAMVVHMGGELTSAALADWLQLDLSQWQVAIATPSLALAENLQDHLVFDLQDSQGILLERELGPKA